MVGERARAPAERELVSLGLSWPDWVVLTASRRPAGMSQSAVADRARLDRTTVGNVLRDLEHEGLIVREGDRVDRRRVRVYPTPSGAELAETAMDAVLATEVRALRPLDRRQRQRLRGTLDRVLPPDSPGLLDYLAKRV